jgi:hypothetical protein
MIAALAALLALACVGFARSQDRATTPLEAAQAKLATAERYAMSSTIRQQLVPLARPELIGSRDEYREFQIDGVIVPGGTTRYVFQSNDPTIPPAALIEENGQLFVERAGTRTPAGTTTGAMPTLNPLTYLAAADQIRSLDPISENGQTYTRYAFAIDGTKLVDLLSRQVRAGTTTLAVAALLPQMSGTGELWLDSQGTPARQIVTLTLPQIQQQYRATVTSETLFRDLVAAQSGPLAGVTRTLLLVQTTLFDYGFLLLAALGFVLLAQISLRRNLVFAARLISMGMAAVLAVSPVLLPAQPASAAPTDQLLAQVVEPTAQAVAPPAPNQSQPAASTALPLPAPNQGAGCGDGAVGTDTDGDQLSDQQEFCLGTDPYRPDTDGDGVNDGAEVTGFSFASQQWPTDPLSPDTNRDGQLDTAEWPAPAGAANTPDLDNDGVPSVWDTDDDGDGVFDSIDLSPEARTAQVPAYTISTTGDGYTGYQYIELQVRPSDPNRMRYTTTALDWPYDTEGQIQDHDSSLEDVRLVPMLEAKVTVAPDAELAKRYNVSIVQRNNETFLYLPLSPIGEGGQVQALTTRFAYGPAQPSNARIEARMVWLVNGTLDRQIYDKLITNDPTVVQTYPEPSFQVTGLHITLSRNVESAIIATPTQADERYLFQLLYGWQAGVMNAQQLEGQSPVRTTLEEALFRLTASNTPLERRFGIPQSVAITGTIQRYAHIDEALSDLSSRRVAAFLQAQGYGATSRPALALAYEEESGSTGLDDLNQFEPAATFSAGLSAIPRHTVRGIKLAAYTNVGGWRNLGIEETAQIGANLPPGPALTALQARYPNLTAAELRSLLATLYLSWATGVSRMISVNGVSDLPTMIADNELATRLSNNETTSTAYLVELLQLGAPGGGLRIGFSQAGDYDYQRATQNGLGLTLPGVDRDAFRTTNNSTTIAGQEIPRLSVPGLFSVYQRYKSVETLSAFVTKGKKFTEWFKTNKAWGKITTFSKAKKLAGPALLIGAAWATFGMTTDFSNPKAVGAAVTLAIVTTVVAVALFVVSLNPLGSVLTAILGFIDLLLFLSSGSTFTDRVNKAIAEFFYDYNILTQLDSADFYEMDSTFADPNRGVIVGNKFIVTSSFKGVVSRTSDGDVDDLNSSSVRGTYDPDSTPGVVSTATNGNTSCVMNSNRTVQTCTNAVGAEYLLTAPAINTRIAFTGRVTAVTYTEECILGVCDEDREVDVLPENPQPTELFLDVLPNTINGLWNWNALGNPDLDGDGLTATQEQQAGTSPSNWDSDNDGLSDQFELQRATSPLQADSDTDGLDDALELRYNTNPLQADSDNDGLPDGSEIRRYEAGQWRGGWMVTLPENRTVAVFGEPRVGDSDGDRLSDLSEQLSGSSPFAANQGPTFDLRLSPVASAPNGRVGMYGRPGEQVRIDLALLNGGVAPITSTLELCLPALLTNPSGGTLVGARRPALQSGTCAAGQRFAWSFAGANALQVGELITTTLTARIDPALPASASATVTAGFPYETPAELAGGMLTRQVQRSLLIAADMDSPQVTLGGLEDGAVLNGGSFVLGGSASDPTSWVTAVEVSSDGGTTWQPTTLLDNEWSYVWAPTTDGNYTLQARATDYHGQRSSSAPISVRVDNTAPSVTTNLLNNTVVRPLAGSEKVLLSGNASDNLVGLMAVQVSIDGKPWRDTTLTAPGAPNSNWSFEWQLPGGAAAQGRHTIAFRARDLAGNVSSDTALVRSFVVDMVPPTDDLITTEFLNSVPPEVQVGVPLVLNGRSDDTGNAPRPSRPQPLNGTLDALQGATVWLMPDTAAEIDASSQATWLGDINGDGRGDLAVGLPAGANGAGWVVVVDGRGGDWPSVPDVEALAASGSRFVGRTGAAIGGLVAPAGDTNADGYNDFLIGDPANGQTYLILGRDGGYGRETILNGATLGGRVRFDTPGVRLVAPAGDVNRDGADDLLLGYGGRLYLVSGRIGAWPEQAAAPMDALASWPLPNTAVATGVGDTNGDSFDDLAIGDSATGTLQLWLGRADLLRGSSASLTAGASYSGFGGPARIVALGRVDAGAQSDFAFSTASYAQLVLNGGSAQALNYTNATNGLLAAPGDINADGAAEILLGVPGDQSALLIDGASRNVLATLTGVAAAASVPYAAGADLNCDASSDLLLIPTAAPADAPPESIRVLDPAQFIAPSRLPGASITNNPPAPVISTGTRVVDDDYCASCANDGLIWNTTAFSSIQSAIDTAGPLNTILVRPGVYSRFSIGSARSGLAVVGANPDAVIVEGAGANPAVQISNATAVRISGMTMRSADTLIVLAAAGVGGANNPALGTLVENVVLYNFSNAIRMTRDSVVEVRRSTIAGKQTSGSYISIDPTPDNSVIATWASAGTIQAAPQSFGTGGRLAVANNTLFAARGGNTTDFYRYTSASNTWSATANAPVPLTTGSVVAGGGDNNVYALPTFDPALGSIQAIAVDGSNIYVAGQFQYVDQNGAALQVNNVAMWNGSSWSTMGGGINTPGEYISALTVVQGKLYAATTPITPLSGGPCCGVFRWDSPSWTRILQSVEVDTGTGDPNVTILTMTTDGTKLYVAGNFSSYTPIVESTYSMGGSGVLIWTPSSSSWSHASTSSNIRPITALAVNPVNGDIYTGNASGYVYRAQSNSFDPMAVVSVYGGPGPNSISALLWDSGSLYVGGTFRNENFNAGTFNNIFRYTPGFPATIEAFGTGLNGPVHSLIKSGSSFYVSGNFTTAGGSTSNDVAAWNGSSWTTFAGNLTDSAAGVKRPIAVAADGSVLVGGDFQGFTNAAGTDTRVHDLARYAAGSWGPLAASAYGVTAATPPALARFLTGSSTWENRGRVWADLRTGSTMTSDGANALYLLKGSDGSFYRYTIGSDGWQRQSNLPIPAGAGSTLAWAGTQLYAVVGGSNRLFRYDPSNDTWACSVQVLSAFDDPSSDTGACSVQVSPAFGAFDAGAGLVWDGGAWLYTTNGGNGNRLARYQIATKTWDDLGTSPGLFTAGGSLARLGTQIYASRGASPAIDRYGPVNVATIKLQINQSAFVAPSGVTNPDWIDLDAATTDFAYTTSASQWSLASGQAWATPGAAATTGLSAARILDQGNNIYRTQLGSSLTAGYFIARPDAYVSPLYCATCANDGYIWGQTAFNSIQAAINHGAPRILLGPGVYRETIQLVSGVQVIGAGADLSIIEAPSTNLRAVVTAEGVYGATLARVSIVGAGTAANMPAGVIVEQGAQQLRIARSIIRNTPLGIQVNDDSTKLEVVNTTIVGNAAGMQVNGAGANDRVNVRNSLFASNSGVALGFSGATVRHSYNGYFQNGTDVSGAAPAVASVAADPLFVNPANHDYRLRDGSPMINAGNPSDPTPPGTSGRVDLGYVQRGQAAFYADDNYGQNGVNDGLDWQVDAFATIQEALDAAERALRAVGCQANANGECAYQITVGVGPGTYTEQVRLPSQMLLRGSGAEQTIINAGAGTGVTLSGVVNAGISGVTITGTSAGTGVLVRDASNTVEVQRTIIRNLGTGVRVGTAASAKVSFSTITNNATAVQADGAGSWVRVEHAILSNNTVGLTSSAAGNVLADFTLLHTSPTGSTGVVLGDGMIVNQNPLFVAAASNNYRLQASSPALDAAAPWATPPAGGGVRADLGYAERMARPVVLLFGKEGLSCAVGNSGVQSTDVGIRRVTDLTLPLTATLPLTWAPATLAQAGAAASYWTATVTPASAGTYRIYTRATDVAGNQETNTRVLYTGSFVADGTAPSVAWSSTTPIVSAAAAINLVATTDDGAAPVLAFEFNDGSRTFQVPAGWGDATWSGGNRSFRTSAAIPTGVYTATAVVRDRAGNSGRSANRSITIIAPTQPVATITSPTSGGFTNQSQIVVTGIVRFPAVNGPGSVSLNVNGGAPVLATLADPYALSSSWSAVIALGAPGSKTITATPANNAAIGTPTSIVLTLDQTAPSLTAPAPATPVTRAVNLAGTASDAESGLANVAVSFDGGFVWLPATLAAGNWSITWNAPDAPQNVRYPVRVRARDLAGNERITPLVLTVDTNAPELGELTFNIAPETRLDTPPAPTLTASWTPAMDDGGSVTLYAAINQTAIMTPTTSVVGTSIGQALNTGGEWYFHIRAVDAAGNNSIRHVGPWYVRDVGACAVLPIISDGLIDLAANEWRTDRHLVDDDERPAVPQSLYAALDVDSLHLGWRGARWAVDGTLYVYFATGGSGTVAPVTAMPGVAALPFAADLALAVSGPNQVSLWRFNGSVWQTQTIDPAQISVAQSASGDTEFRLDRALVGSLAQVLAVAVGPDGAPWSIFPTTNPLSGAWTAAYNWSTVTDCSTPMSNGQPRATSLSMTVIPAQDAAQPVGPGTSVGYQLRLENKEPRSLSGAEVRLSATTGLTYAAPTTLLLPTLAPNSVRTITVTGQLAATLGALQLVTSTFELNLNGMVQQRIEAAQRVDGLPPTVDLDLSAGNALLPGAQTLTGRSSDGVGSGVDRVELLPENGAWQAAIGTLRWNRTLVVPTQQNWWVDLRAIDRNGLSSTPQRYTFTIDQVPPTVTLRLPPVLAGASAVITGTTNDPFPAGARVAQVQVQIGNAGADWGAGQVYEPDMTGTQRWSYTWALPDADNAPYTLRARAIDEAGNVSAETAWLSTRVDTRAPTITVTQALTNVDLAVYPETALLEGVISDGSGVATLQMRVFTADGRSYVEPVQQNATTWSYTPQQPLIAGTYQLQLETSDTVGNQRQQRFGLTVVGQAPPSLTVAINRLDPSPTNATSVRFELTFNMAVTGVVSSNLALNTSGLTGTAISGLIGSGSVYTVTVSTGTGDGTLGLDMVNSTGVENIVRKPVTNLPLTGPAYLMDRTRPLAAFDAVVPALRNSAVPTMTIRVSKPISGLDLGDLSLTRDNLAVALTGASVVEINPQLYELRGLVAATAAEGAYLLTLASTGSGIADRAGNPLAADATGSFRVDLTAPTVSIDSVTPSPRNTVVPSLTITLSEPTIGVDLADLLLTRDGGTNLLSGTQTLTSSDSLVFTLGNLAGLTNTDGSYALTLNPSGSGITDLAGNPLVVVASSGFTIDRTAPTVVAIDRLDAPLTNVASVRFAVRFSEPVTTLTAANLVLETTGLSGTLITGVNGSGTTWVVDASTGTGNGTLGVRLANSAGLRDLVGNAVVDFTLSSAVYTLDRATLLATVLPVSPDPRPTGVAQLSIQFGKPVSGLDLADLTLTRDSGGNLLTGSETLTSTDGMRWTLDELSDLTAAQGVYTLTLRATGSGIVDGATNPLAADASGSFRVDLTAPTVSIDSVTPSPRNSGVGQIVFRFSEPISGFGIGDLQLMRDGGSNVLSGAEVLTSSDGLTWRLDGLAGITTPTGGYQLRLDAANTAIRDQAGNLLLQGAEQRFEVDTTPPEATILAIEPSPRNSAVNNITIRFSEAVTGLTLADLQLLRNGVPVALVGATLTGSGTQYELSGLADRTQATGVYLLRLVVAGAAIRDAVGNPPRQDATQTFEVDTTAPTAQFDSVLPNPRQTAVKTMVVRFSEPVRGLTLSDLSLTHNDRPVALSATTLTSDVTGQVWTISGLERQTALIGEYTMTLRASASIVDRVGNRLATDTSTSFSYNQTYLYVPFATSKASGPDLVATVQFTPDRRSFRTDERVVISVRVTNHGDVAAGLFWVDLMLNPAPIPTEPTSWNSTCTLRPCYGLAWYVDRPLAPGETITLTSLPGSYAKQYSNWRDYLNPAVTSLYVVLDSWNGTVAGGAVRESDETNNIVAVTGIVVQRGTTARLAATEEEPVIPPRPAP